MESWFRLDSLDYFCEYGVGTRGGIHCEHSSDVVDGERDGIRNAAHWKLNGEFTANAPSFLCDYHYEELVMGIKHPQDEPVPEAQFEAPSAEEFATGIGEVK